MKIIQNGINVELADDMKEYVEEKLGILERYVEEQDENVEIKFSVRVDNKHQSGNIFNVNATFFVKGNDFFAEENAPDFFAAVDLLQEKLERQLRKYKEEKKDGIGKGTARGE